MQLIAYCRYISAIPVIRSGYWRTTSLPFHQQPRYSTMLLSDFYGYCQTFKISRTLAGIEIVIHSDAVGASPVWGLLPLHLHSRLNTWLQWIEQIQLHFLCTRREGKIYFFHFVWLILRVLRNINCLPLSVSRIDYVQSCLCFLKIIELAKDYVAKQNKGPPGNNKTDPETSAMFDKLRWSNDHSIVNAHYSNYRFSTSQQAKQRVAEYCIHDYSSLDSFQFGAEFGISWHKWIAAMSFHHGIGQYKHTSVFHYVIF